MKRVWKNVSEGSTRDEECLSEGRCHQKRTLGTIRFTEEKDLNRQGVEYGQGKDLGGGPPTQSCRERESAPGHDKE